MSTMATQSAMELHTTQLPARMERVGAGLGKPRRKSPASTPALSGPPQGWSTQRPASGPLHGAVVCDGPIWKLSAKGTAQPNEFFSVTTEMRHGDILRARFRQRLSVPFLRTGLALFTPDAATPRVMLLFEAASAAATKRQSTVRFYTWDEDIKAPLLRREQPAAGGDLAETEDPLFLRLGISSGAIVAAVSPNGSDWIIMDGGTAPSESLRAGMVLNSGSEQHLAHVWIDNVALKPSLI